MPARNRHIGTNAESIRRMITSEIASLNVDMLAMKAGISAKHLYFFCKKHYNCTPKQAIGEYRLFKCILSFAYEPSGIMDTSLALGYNNPESLHRAVKSCYGMTPAALRRRIRAMTEDEKLQEIAEMYSRVSLFRTADAVLK